MYFTANRLDQIYERQMTRIPRCRETDISPTDEETSEISGSDSTVNHSRLPPVQFRNSRHEMLFNMAASNFHIHSPHMLAALYLLTADNQLWQRSKHVFDKQKKLNLEELPLTGLSISAYTLDLHPENGTN